MKKSTNPDPAPATPIDSTSTEAVDVYKPPLLWEIVTGEGGLSVAIIYPLVVLFFLKMAYSTFG